MINIFKTESDTIKEIPEYEPGCWMNITNPTKEELESISQKFAIPANFLTDPLDTDEISRCEVDDGCTLIILRVPRVEVTNTNIPFTTLPMGIILADQLVITVCSEYNHVLVNFLKGKVKKFTTSERSRFVLQMFHQTAVIFLGHLKEINKKTALAEEELKRTMRNSELIRLYGLEKSLVFFTTSLRSNELVMERLQRTDVLRMNPDDKELLEDAVIENKQAMQMSNIYSDILSSMMDSFASIISNNLNVVMKILTAITIIIMLPTLVVSTFGMNVHFPFATESAYAFPMIMGICVIMALTGIVIFNKSKWF